MAYVRKRTTKAGTVSTALVQSYRDARGRPRQRIIANLHGEPTALAAAAKLAKKRECLREVRDKTARMLDPFGHRLGRARANEMLHGITEDIARLGREIRRLTRMAETVDMD